MKMIFKYPIPLKNYFSLELPQKAVIISFQSQNDIGCIWAIVDNTMPLEKRNFRLAGTGHPIDETNDKLKYIGSSQFKNGMLVFHLFEIFS